MREILFRGKRVDNGEWYEGSDIMTYTIRGEYCLSDAGCDDWFAVTPETIGQYTGMKDKNGVKIFEGDIVVWDYDTADIDGSTHTTPEFVRWDNELAAFAVNIGDTMFYLDARWRVIGNIYDNPELMGEVQ